MTGSVPVELSQVYAPRADEIAALSYLVRPGDYFLRVTAACCDADSSTLPYVLHVTLE